MVIKREVANGIISGLEKFWNCEELQDFTVSIGISQFGCHRFLLAVCSEFFRGLFRSGMKETELKCVSIQDISVTTFKSILQCMYTGNDILTKDNVIDIWRAANQLQIDFLISECEGFVIKNVSLENYVEYLQVCKELDSDQVQEEMWSFVHKNANSFFQTDYFLELPFSEICDLVKCQNLETQSEDDVIQAILKWVAFQDDKSLKPFLIVKKEDEANLIKPQDNTFETSEVFSENVGFTIKKKKKRKKKNVNVNNDSVAVRISTENCCDTESGDSQTDITNKDARNIILIQLLSRARTCLASKTCLKMLLKHPLTKDRKEIKDIIIDALLYKLQVDTINGQWPSKAVQRNNSKLSKCLVRAKKKGKYTTFAAFSFNENQWCKLPAISDVTNVKLVSVGTKLLALCNKGATSDLILYQLSNETWLNRKQCHLNHSMLL